jgi:cephalosporin hydroxylase
MDLETKYLLLCNTPSDINEHLSTLYEYSKSCESVLELGVRSGVSTFAFMKGLSENGSSKRSLVSGDLNEISSMLNQAQIITFCRDYSIDYTFILGNDLDIKIESVGETDITFIDTWHIYGHLKRELIKFAPITKRYIIMHDTTLDGVYGETIRCGWNAEKQYKETGIPVEEINCGLRKAIIEFLEKNKDWSVDYETERNNGLTILKRNIQT